MFWFIQIKITIQKGIKPEDTIYQKVLLKIMMLSSTEKTFDDQAIDSVIK